MLFWSPFYNRGGVYTVFFVVYYFQTLKKVKCIFFFYFCSINGCEFNYRFINLTLIYNCFWFVSPCVYMRSLMKKGFHLIYILGPYLNNLSCLESWWFSFFHLHSWKSMHSPSWIFKIRFEIKNISLFGTWKNLKSFSCHVH